MPRLGLGTKPSYSRNMSKFRISKDPSASSVNESEVLEQFRQHQERAREKYPIDDEEGPDEDAVRRRISYTKEQKLAAVRYAKTTLKTQPDGSTKPITKYAASSDLGISTKMLRDWINKEHEIAGLTTGARKNRSQVENVCQEPVMEARLLELFKDARKSGEKVNKAWFLRHGKHIYGSLHPDRIVKHPGKPITYSGFKFSDGWFQNFRRRTGISTRSLTSETPQQVGWLQKDTPSVQLNDDWSPTPRPEEDEQAAESPDPLLNDHDGNDGNISKDEATKTKLAKREHVSSIEKDGAEGEEINQSKSSDDSEMDDDDEVEYA